MQLANRLRSTLGVDVALRDIFEHPTRPPSPGPSSRARWPAPPRTPRTPPRGADPAVVRAEPALVPAPVGRPERHVQPVHRGPSGRGAGPGGAAARRRGRRRPPREPAHGLPGRRRAAPPAHPGRDERPRRLRPRGGGRGRGERPGGGAAGPGDAAHRHHRGDPAPGPAAAHRHRPRPGPDAPSHRGRRMVDASPRRRSAHRLHRPRERHRTRLGAAARRLRGLRALAA